MKFFQKVLSRFTGLHYPQEYLCLAKESFPYGIHATLVSGQYAVKDITNQYLFTGYHPLIFVLNSVDDTTTPDNITIVFTTKSLSPNERIKKKDALAQISLKKIHQFKAGNQTIFYYEGVRAMHHFLSSFHQYIIGLNNRLYNKKPGNVFLHNDLYKQVQIAYASPRIISLVTVKKGDMYNLFPTDLHGQVHNDFYIISLRHQGKACQQVEEAGQIVLSQIHSQSYKLAYSLGKNHMKEMTGMEKLPFGLGVSDTFHLPLPEPVLYYRELQLEGSFVSGIHKLLFFRIISRQKVSNELSTLSHIHNSFATWLHNKGLAGNYLLR